ncbi:hypothetical protein GOBAR_DD16968 [Gossypium barbadense]|nr:hypothetical protein GOBAR_DD16968 [Gossypium barbadense]
MWNPRLISEDVGVGVNVRQLRRYFLSSFTTVYSMRPLAAGAVFRCYPGLWKVFYDDKDRLGRYLLAKELVSRPDAEELEGFRPRRQYHPPLSKELHTKQLLACAPILHSSVYSMRPLAAGAVFRCYPIIFGNAEEKSEQGPSFFSQAAGIFSSLNRFVKAISK